ncbi:MAG: hypothetical protein IJO43_00110 [Bacilli bacterium]|nr:hypothetical protein [Bacilli bacterium]
MSITIRGLKQLNADDYSAIIIREGKEGFRVDVKASKNSLDTTKNNHYISDELQNLDAHQAIINIVEYFLRNNKIDYIGDKKILQRYDGKFGIVSGKRKLYMQVSDKKLSGIPKMVMGKYLMDRAAFFEECKDIPFYEASVSADQTSYVKSRGNDGDFVSMTLKTNGDGLANFEKRFLQEFIYDRLTNIGEEAKIIHPCVFYKELGTYVDLGKYLVCGDFRMRLYGHELNGPVREVMNRYNDERKQAKKMQLRMEGF